MQANTEMRRRTAPAFSKIEQQRSLVLLGRVPCNGRPWRGPRLSFRGREAHSVLFGRVLRCLRHWSMKWWSIFW